MIHRLCFELTRFDYKVRLIQTGRNIFTVEYGGEVWKGLTYAQAATILGGSIIHALTCDGMLLFEAEPESERKVG